ncbi:hypothetical protein CVT24_010617 [Panaeolus cyanescens]|uniref:DUF396-domain-containing protein n=1 Tax=Panaeolus cyanescens TaxID=181874 RepID=A0A409YM01_9AGAR|nr:hypothetical protein CVT24_010617 [Panaeolus cyanescens]
MGLLYYISYLAVVAAFAFVTLSLASGLLYVSELIEEHSRVAKLVGQRSIYFIIVLHVLFYFTDSLPLLQTLFSIACHVVYLQNFSSTWPLISLTSISFLASCVLVVSDHFIWFFYFARLSSDARYLRTYRGIHTPAPNFLEIASFFGICVWFTPLFLFLSLSANDNALPLTTAEPSSPNGTTPFVHTAPERVSLIRQILSYISFDSVPRLRPRPSRKDTSEGIIAPRSPAMRPHSPLPHVASSPSLRPDMYPVAPPRSPGARVQEIDVDVNLSPGPSAGFRLNNPPGRRPQPTRTSSDSFGLGISMRRTGSQVAKDD